MFRLKSFVGALCAIFLLSLSGVSHARAEVGEVRFAQQLSFAYLHLNVMEHLKLVEKHAAALGIPNLKVSYLRLNGADLMNDAILSGKVDFAAVGVPGFLTLWDKTVGTSREVAGVAANGHFNLLMNTWRPDVKSIADIKPNYRIATTTLKVAAQAIAIEMAAAKLYGTANYAKFDNQVFVMSPPDMYTAMFSGSPTPDITFSSPPFTVMELKNPKVHTILSSVDVVGRATSAMIFTTRAFHDANPTVYRAVFDAMVDAQAFIDSHLADAMGFYAQDSNTPPAMAQEMTDMFKDPNYGFSLVPEGITLYSDFLSSIGTLKHNPKDWKDVFLPEVYPLADKK